MLCFRALTNNASFAEFEHRGILHQACNSECIEKSQGINTVRAGRAMRKVNRQ